MTDELVTTRQSSSDEELSPEVLDALKDVADKVDALVKKKRESRMMCKFCGTIFNLEDISTPMDPPTILHFVYVKDECPNCKRGFDDWYVSMRGGIDYYLHEILPRAIRYQRNIPPEEG